MGVGSMENPASKTVMVTGAGGFLGKNLVAELASRGHSVYAVTSKSEGELSASELAAVVPNRDFEAISELLDRTDVLVNCAFPRNVDGRQLADGMDYLQRVFAIAGASQVGAVVNISSQSVYSQTRTEPAREDTPVCLEGKYAVAKYASEQLLEAYCGDKPHTNIRLASLIGPGFDQRVVNKMARRAMENGQIEVCDNGSSFGYLDVLDAVNALVAVCESDPDEWEQVYNLGPEGGVTLTEIAECAAKEVGARCGRQVKLLMGCSDSRATSSVLDSALFARSFDWEARNSLLETVKRIVDFADEGAFE